jgi:hypothetical protein
VAVAAGLFVSLEKWQADEKWYGFAIGDSIDQVSGGHVTPRSPMQNFKTARVDKPPAPWSEASLATDPGSDTIHTIFLIDYGIEPIMCDAAPCPQHRLKPVETIRAEGERIRAELTQRMGVPTGIYGAGREATYVWDFEKPGLECRDRRLQHRVLAGDRTGTVGQVDLKVSDLDVTLTVTARSGLWRNRRDPNGTPPAPSPPPPPAPPTPPCP